MKTWVLILAILIFGGLALWFGRQSSGSSVGNQSVPASKPAAPIDAAVVRAKAESGDPKAQAQLGSLYAKGQGVTNDFKEAAKWFRLAADKGNADAQLGLGELYEAGQGVPKDGKEAMKLYRMAAEQGNVGAQYTIAFMYEAGRGVPQDHKEAAKWFQLAAEQGDALSQYDLGQRYELGVGVQVDNVEALKWFLLASAQGQADAGPRVDQVRKKMSRDQINEAKRRADSFVPKRVQSNSSVAPR